MKNKIVYFIILSLLTSKIYGQDTIYVQDTVFVYDKIVYDTVKVYDTIKVEDKKSIHSEHSDIFFKKNNTIESAVLAIDTTTSKAQLFLFNKNDTATISINRIILSENLKNLENMKKEILTLAVSAMLTQSAFAQNAQESKTITDVPKKEIVIGAGLSGTLMSTISNGANLKFDYLLTNKFCTGLKSTFTNRKELNYPDTKYPIYINVNKGNNYNLMLTSTYYIFGKNSSEGKGGFYTTFGAGYAAKNISTTITSNTPVSDSLYYKYSEDFKSKNFSIALSLGGDRKLGPGRIYLEIPFTLDILGTMETKFYNQAGTTNKVDQKKTGLREPINNVEMFINIGYHLYF